MPRENHRIAIALAGIVLSAPLAAYLGYSAVQVQVNGPTAQEYAVYGALLPHIAEGSKEGIVAQKRTSALSLPVYDSTPPTPVELRIRKVEDASFPDFEDYCGRCAKDFLKKNLKAWPLQQTLDYSSVARGALRGDDSILVPLSRVGFNVWHTRAVVMFQPIVPIPCLPRCVWNWGRHISRGKMTGGLWSGYLETCFRHMRRLSRQLLQGRDFTR
jgi:hypothetical protein